MLIQFIVHGWKRGHSIEVRKYQTTLAKQNGKGWLYKCECGAQWSR